MSFVGTSAPKSVGSENRRPLASTGQVEEHVSRAYMELRVSSSSKDFFSDGQIFSVPMKLVFFVLICRVSSPAATEAATESLRRRQRSEHRPAWAPRSTTFENVLRWLTTSIFVAKIKLFSGHQLCHVLRGGIAAIPSLTLFHNFIFLFLQMFAGPT